MITIGVDAHKRVHVALALDDAGRELAYWRGPNSVTGWEQLFEWAQAWQAELQWEIEGAWGYGRGLAQFLVAAGAAGLRGKPSLDGSGQKAGPQIRQDGPIGRPSHRPNGAPGGRGTAGHPAGRPDDPIGSDDH
jgi:Transposase